jgi:hypothetical protein
MQNTNSNTICKAAIICILFFKVYIKSFCEGSEKKFIEGAVIFFAQKK